LLSGYSMRMPMAMCMAIAVIMPASVVLFHGAYIT
jgi:hypothetical protein